MADASATSSAIPLDEPDVAFAEPWHAQAFAVAVQLSRRGLFTWREWVGAFSAEIRAHPQRIGESVTAAYYRQWLAALEQMIVERGQVSPQHILDRKEDWRAAYLHTPHGMPVELENRHRAADEHDHDHGHHDHSHGAGIRPVAVSAAQ